MPQPRKMNMAEVRRRAKREVRKKHKKTVSLSKIQQIWKDFVDLKVIPELIQNGEVKLDNNTTIRIEGTKILKSPKLGLLKSGLAVKNGMMVKGGLLNKGRDGIIYQIVLSDKSFKEGKIIFTPTSKIKKAVHNSLKNTSTYYHVNQ